MPNELTEQQRVAVEHRAASVVLASGAGCGKTHVLTARYLSHLADDGAEVSQVVAITFTERAAREMRDRIRTAVASRVTADAPRWREHLRNLETAPIATIHSFCGNLLRQHAVAVGLDPGFEVLDDVLSANIRGEALRAALHGLLEADPESSPACDLRELIVLFGWPAVFEAIDALLLEPDPRAWAEWAARDPADTAADWLGPRRAGLLPGWVPYLVAASPKIAPALAVIDHTTTASPEANATLRRIAAAVPALHESRNLAAAVEEVAALAKVQGMKKKDWNDDAAYESVKKAFADLRGDLPKRLSLFTESFDGVAEAAAVGQRFLRVAVAAEAEYRRRKRRAGAVDFADLLSLARDLVRDRPDVRDDLRRRFRFILLDELQDTDPVQMELVEYLCGPGLTLGTLFAVGDHKQSIYRFRGADVSLFRNLREQVPADGRLGLTRNYRSQPGVLRFVNALFAKRVPDYDPLEAQHPAAGTAENVEFLWAVPAVGSCPSPLAGEGGPGFAGRGGGTSSRHSDVPSPGSQSLTALSRKGRGEESSTTDVRESAADVRRREADAIARRVVELLADDTPRVLGKDGTPRRVRAGDVVLLFRSMSHVATYEAALRQHGLDYYLVGGRAFFAQQEVYDLLNLLRAVENPQDGASLVGTLRSPFCNLSDEAVFLLASHRDGPWAGLFDPDRFDTLPADQKPAADRARRNLGRWRSQKDRLSIARLLNAVFADSGYDAATQFEFLGDRKLANLWKLLDMARDFDRSGLFGLHEFAARLGDMVARQPREEQAATLPENADVVRLMSIHQSKGLEFPVVVVPDLAAPARGDRHPVARWHRDLGCLVRLPAEFETLEEDGETGERPPFSDFADRLGRTADQLADWQEDLRVLYVACTRARDLLVLSAGLPEPLGPAGRCLPPKAANHWTLAVAERFDLFTGACVATDVNPQDAPAVRVRIVGPAPEPTPTHQDRSSESLIEPKPAHGRARAYPPTPLPRLISLPALERFARGESVPSLAEQFDTEADTERSHWRTPRERLDPLPPLEAVLWAVLDRWPLADVDAWGQLLSDALEDVTDAAESRRCADRLPRLLRAFAESDARRRLAAAGEVRRGVEFIAPGLAAQVLHPGLTAVTPPGFLALEGRRDLAPGVSPGHPRPPALRGMIDFLYRDRTGWHVLAVDLGTAHEDDPWRGRRPGLLLQAWAVSQQIGEWPATVELFDLGTGQFLQTDPRKHRPEAAFAHIHTLLDRWTG